VPARWRHNVLITADGAGATHDLLDWITALDRPAHGEYPGMRVEYSVGWPVDKHTGKAIALLPAAAWTPMLAADGLPGTPAILDHESDPDTVGEVAEITPLLHHLHTWPPGLGVYVRRVKPLRDTTPKPLTGVDQLELDLHPRKTLAQFVADVRTSLHEHCTITQGRLGRRRAAGDLVADSANGS
jgi:hypothetical protein